LSFVKLSISGDINKILDNRFINIGTVSLYHCGYNMYETDLNLLYYTNLLSITDNKIEFNIDNFPVLAGDSRIEIICDNFLNDYKFEIVGNINTISEQEAIEMKTNYPKQIIFDLHGEHYKSNSSKIKITNYFRHISNGLYIIGNINNISNINYQFGQLHFNFTKQEIDSICTKFSDSVIFFPFSKYSKYDELTYESFCGGINFSKCDHCNSRIEIDFNTYDNEIIVFSNSINFIQYRNIQNLISSGAMFSR